MKSQAQLSTSIDNDLLGELPTAIQRRLRPLLKRVDLRFGQVIYDADQDIDHVYFPGSCIVSLACVMLDGASAEIAVIGREGLVGVTAFMGGSSTRSRALVQSAGGAYRLTAADLRREFDREPIVRVLLLRYTQSLITQMAQTAVCNRHHSIDQQLCRWLLLALDRLPGNQLKMTQEVIANRLGVRREGVTEAAGKLQKLGAIRYSRGHITVLNRPLLKELSCECYQAVKDETHRLRARPPLIA